MTQIHRLKTLTKQHFHIPNIDFGQNTAMAFDKFVSISTVQTMHIWVNRRDVDSSCFNYPNSNKTVCVCVCVTRRSRANVVAIIKIAVVSLQTLSISQIRVVVVNKHTISIILQFYLSTGWVHFHLMWCVESIIIIVRGVDRWCAIDQRCSLYCLSLLLSFSRLFASCLLH